MRRLESVPAVRWVFAHPRLAGWFILAVGMIALLIIEAGDLGLLPTQWGALIIATILVAGLCVWIVSWDDNNEGEPAPDTEALTNINADPQPEHTNPS